jgi:hypothetical protein
VLQYLHDHVLYNFHNYHKSSSRQNLIHCGHRRPPTQFYKVNQQTMCVISKFTRPFKNFELFDLRGVVPSKNFKIYWSEQSFTGLLLGQRTSAHCEDWFHWNYCTKFVDLLYRIEWEAYDDHSGLDSVYWKIYDNYGNYIEHGHEDIVAHCLELLPLSRITQNFWTVSWTSR